MVLFEGWWTLGRILLYGMVAFTLLLAVIRMTGQRTIATMNASDFIVTVAVGSTLATFLINREASLSEGLVALTLLLALNAAVEWVSSRRQAFRRTLEGRPRLLFYEGEFLHDALRHEHVSEDEIRATMRLNGARELHDVHAVVLEINGSLSVLRGRGPRSALLADVIGA